MSIQDFKPVLVNSLLRIARLSDGRTATDTKSISFNADSLEKARQYAKDHGNENAAIIFANMKEELKKIDLNGDGLITLSNGLDGGKSELDYLNEKTWSSNSRNLLSKGDFEKLSNSPTAKPTFKPFHKVSLEDVHDYIIEATGKINNDSGVMVNVDDIQKGIDLAKDNEDETMVRVLTNLQKALATDFNNIDQNNDGFLEIEKGMVPNPGNTELEEFSNDGEYLRNSDFGINSNPYPPFPPYPPSPIYPPPFPGGGGWPNPGIFPPIGGYGNPLMLLMNLFRLIFGFQRYGSGIVPFGNSNE